MARFGLAVVIHVIKICFILWVSFFKSSIHYTCFRQLFLYAEYFSVKEQILSRSEVS